MRGPLRRDHHPARCARRPAATRTSSRSRCRSASTRAAVSAHRAGSARPQAIIGVLDVPDLFLDPRPRAGGPDLVRPRFRRIPVSEQCQGAERRVAALEFVLELSSEVPGHQCRTGPPTFSSGSTTSRSGPGRRRATTAIGAASYTPRWWKLEGSQYGELTRWHISERGTFRSAEALGGDARPSAPAEHHSIRLRVGIDEGADIPEGSTSSAAASETTTRTSSCASTSRRGARAKSVQDDSSPAPSSRGCE